MPENNPRAHHLVMVAQTLTHARLDDCLRAIDSAGADLASAEWLSEGYAAQVALDLADTDRHSLTSLLRQKQPAIDCALVPSHNRRKRLLVSDMDSTIIQNETIDLLAAELGFGERVAAITERAMQGELDFGAALAERVALLRGLPEKRLVEIPNKASITPGAFELVQTMRTHGACTILVSGGFDFMARTIGSQVGFEQTHANALEVTGGELSGATVGTVVDADTKLDLLQQATTRLGLGPDETLSIGDGANDLKMIAASAMGIAFHAKPVVREQALYHINHTDLRTALYYQGYHDDQIIRPQ